MCAIIFSYDFVLLVSKASIKKLKTSYNGALRRLLLIKQDVREAYA